MRRLEAQQHLAVEPQVARDELAVVLATYNFPEGVCQMGVQGALIGAVGFFAADLAFSYAIGDRGLGVARYIPGMDGYGFAAASATVVPLAGAVYGFYYL